MTLLDSAIPTDTSIVSEPTGNPLPTSESAETEKTSALPTMPSHLEAEPTVLTEPTVLAEPTVLVEPTVLIKHKASAQSAVISKLEKSTNKNSINRYSVERHDVKVLTVPQSQTTLNRYQNR